MWRLFFIFLVVSEVTMAIEPQRPALRVATFNASMDGTNYVAKDETPSGQELLVALAQRHPQIDNVAAIIRHVRPDVLLINEFDYTQNPEQAIGLFKQILSQRDVHSEGIDYNYHYSAPVNTGVKTDFALTRDDSIARLFGFGFYPGHYGMLLLSRFPIDYPRVRTFQHFLWKDMPDNALASIKNPDGSAYYTDHAMSRLRLSSKSHWDVPVVIGDTNLHILASHPTPPVFDGPEDRNGARNHDEVRFWVDYLNQHDYFYDDQGNRGGFMGQQFVVMGDLNASREQGDGRRAAIKALLSLSAINDVRPVSQGAKINRPDDPYSDAHTASWGMRADYVLPSAQGLEVLDSGVFWPVTNEKGHQWVKSRKVSSDHRLVWVDLRL